MLYLLAQAAVEPPPSGYVSAADLALKHAEQAPNVVFPLLAILGPTAVGGALIWAGVKFGIPFVREQLAEFRKHTAELLKARSDDALGDAMAARELAKAQQEAIVQRIEGSVSRQTGEIAKIAERQERQGDLLRSVAQKIGAGVLLVLLALGLAAGSARSFFAQVTRNECAQHPCATGTHCCGHDKCCRDTGTATAMQGVPHSALYADRRVDCSVEVRP